MVAQEKMLHSKEEKELISIAKEYLPGGYLGNLYRDVIIDRGLAGHIWDKSGTEYIDYLLGSGPMFVGHSHPEITAAVRDQLDKGAHFFANNEPITRLAKEVVEAIPCAEQVRFTLTGGEATSYALRLARALTGKNLILKFEGAYHGMHDYALMSMAPRDIKNFPDPVPDSPGISTAVTEEVLIAPFNDIEKTAEIIDKYRSNLAAVIVEPMQRIIPPRPDFLQQLRNQTQQYDIPLIFDEVVTSFRFAYGGAQEYYGVVPDLCTFAKVIGAGFPLGGIAGPKSMMRLFDPEAVEPERFLVQIGTVSGNPISAVAGLACLSVLRQPGTYEAVFETGRQLMEGLKAALEEADLAGQIVGEPPMFDVMFTEEPIIDYRSTLTNNVPRYKKFTQALLGHGVHRGDSKFYVSTAHTQEDVAQTIQAFFAAAREVKKWES